MPNYVSIKKIDQAPRIPLEGSIDLTYRCNNDCLHCWLRIPPNSPEKYKELTLEEIKDIVKEAKKMGCRNWSISGGEPMMRPDFTEIFDYITRRCGSYSLNTNGSLITPKIAQLMNRKGVKMVALYGATAEVHDHITRNPGSFEATMQGFAYLKEAGAGFMVQLIPLRDNYHQFDKMICLAESLGPHYRVGAAWLFLSAYGDPKKNKEIMHQRLDPKDVIELDKPDVSYEEWKSEEKHSCLGLEEDGLLFASCITNRSGFHIDPYGHMSFCSFIKEPSLRYDLRQGNLEECWEEFIPSIANRVKGGQEFMENCGSCKLRRHCRLCPVYSYLEHGRFSARVDYLCAVAKENRKFKENWEKNHRRYYKIAGITIQVDSDLPITDSTFHPKFKLFEIDGPGEDNITIRHQFFLPDLDAMDLGKEVFRRHPWAIYRKRDSWIYLGISAFEGVKNFHYVLACNDDYTRVRIYNNGEETFHRGGLHSFMFSSTDQLLLAQVLAKRTAFYLHSSGVILNGKGLLFVGHSEAGKSTMVRMLKGKSEILCDDRIIVRRWPEGFRIHGTWHHGDMPEVSANSAPLKAIMFLEQARENRVIPLDDRLEVIRKLLACLIRPFLTVEWWEKTLKAVEKIANEVPCYILRFDKSGDVLDALKRLKEK